MGQNSLQKNADVIIAAAIIFAIVMMVVPLPTFILDLFLSLNLILSLVILLLTTYTTQPLQLSVFPSLLLILTLFRVSLNLLSTRLILLNGFAGEVVDRFGNFVVGGNPVVGFIVFLILILIQFMVITRGAERVAEVAARFTLDAMPGKQMAIDADLNAGMITETEARQRRRDVEREADFYGSMDGASKFVKGDSIAALIILAINLIGGFVIGMLQRNLDATQALQQYALLTVGAGLVTQIPALLVSTATGIIVTRAASDGSLGSDFVGQIFNQPRALTIAAVAVAGLGLVPGLPKLPFFLLAGLFAFFGYTLTKAGPVSTQSDVPIEESAENAQKSENVANLLQIEPLEIELGYRVVPLALKEQGGDLMDRVLGIRRQCAVELGIIVPPVRVRDNLQLDPNAYVILLRGIEVSRGEVHLDQYMAMNPGSVAEEIPGEPTTEPAFGLPALWISSDAKDRAEMAGYTVVDASSIVATHLTEVIRGHAAEILTRQDVQSLIDTVRASAPTVVEELLPNLMTVGEIQKVLQGLLREVISVRTTIASSRAQSARL
jgi:flagellar biosynthesis protein FlhA